MEKRCGRAKDIQAEGQGQEEEEAEEAAAAAAEEAKKRNNKEKEEEHAKEQGQRAGEAQKQKQRDRRRTAKEEENMKQEEEEKAALKLKWKLKYEAEKGVTKGRRQEKGLSWAQEYTQWREKCGAAQCSPAWHGSAWRNTSPKGPIISHTFGVQLTTNFTRKGCRALKCP